MVVAVKTLHHLLCGACYTAPVIPHLLYRTCYNRAPYPARYMLIPSRQGVCLLHRIGRLVIYARDPAFMPQDMIQDCLDHIRAEHSARGL
jgi:hypothetical protein